VAPLRWVGGRRSDGHGSGTGAGAQGRDGGLARDRRAPGHGHGPGPAQFDDPEGAEGVHQGLDLGEAPGAFDDEGVLGDVHHVGAEDLHKLEHLGALGGAGAHPDQGQVPHHIHAAAAQLLDLEDVHQLPQVLHGATGRGLVRIDHHGHAGHLGPLGGTHRQGVDVEAPAAEQGSHAGEDARFIVGVDHEHMRHGFSFQSDGIGAGFGQHAGRGAADHVVERGTGGHHGIDAVLLLDLELDQRRALGGAGSLHGGGHLAAGVHPLAVDAEGLREFHEVRGEDGRGGVAALVEQGLPLADHAEEAVVDDGDVHLDVLLDGRHELGEGHLEAAVPRHHPDLGLGPGQLGADGRRQGEAHGAGSAAGEEAALPVVLVVLGLPHLVLAHVRDHDGLALRQPPEVMHHVGRVEVAVIGQVLDVAHG